MVRQQNDIPDYLSEPFGSDDIPENYLQPEGEALEGPALPVDVPLGLPADGLYGYYDEVRRYGITQTIAALKEVGRIWHMRGTVPAVGIGDISQKNGGAISGHASHRLGIDVDIRPLQKDGKMGPVTFRDDSYSRDLTQELADLIHANGKFAVRFIFFNDPGVSGVQYYTNHDNHLHVRFQLPATVPALPVLARGKEHGAVRELQRRLNFWRSASAPPAGAINIDGDFGGMTHDAVIAFQHAVGIPPDGKVTAATWQRLPVRNEAG